MNILDARRLLLDMGVCLKPLTPQRHEEEEIANVPFTITTANSDEYWFGEPLVNLFTLVRQESESTLFYIAEKAVYLSNLKPRLGYKIVISYPDKGVFESSSLHQVSRKFLGEHYERMMKMYEAASHKADEIWSKFIEDICLAISEQRLAVSILSIYRAFSLADLNIIRQDIPRVQRIADNEAKHPIPQSIRKDRALGKQRFSTWNMVKEWRTFEWTTPDNIKRAILYPHPPSAAGFSPSCFRHAKSKLYRDISRTGRRLGEGSLNPHEWFADIRSAIYEVATNIAFEEAMAKVESANEELDTTWIRRRTLVVADPALKTLENMKRRMMDKTLVVDTEAFRKEVGRLATLIKN